MLLLQTEQERKEVIQQQIEENLYNFLDYMEAYAPPSKDFLHIIVGLRDKLDETSFTNVFVRVCA